MSASIMCGCGGKYQKFTQKKHNKTQKHTAFTEQRKKNRKAQLCTLRALKAIRDIRKAITPDTPVRPTITKKKIVSPVVTEFPEFNWGQYANGVAPDDCFTTADAGWIIRENSYANLQNVYSMKIDGKSIHAFPFHDIEDTKNFVGNLKKCDGFTVNHRTNTFYVHSKIDIIYDNTNKENTKSKKQAWHTLYLSANY